VLELIKKLQLDQFFQEALISAHAKISWAHLVTVLVAARFCEPKSDLHIAEHFYSQTALADLLGIPAHAIYDNRLYRAPDKVLAQKEQLQKQLNCKQVLIAPVVAKEGIPLGYEVFAGNKHDYKTVETIVQQMEARYGHADRIWIMDRGMSSFETLKLLGQNNRRYILGTPKSLLKKFEAELTKTDWKKSSRWSRSQTLFVTLWQQTRNFHSVSEHGSPSQRKSDSRTFRPTHRNRPAQPTKNCELSYLTYFSSTSCTAFGL